MSERIADGIVGKFNAENDEKVNSFEDFLVKALDKKIDLVYNYDSKLTKTIENDPRVLRLISESAKCICMTRCGLDLEYDFSVTKKLGSDLSVIIIRVKDVLAPDGISTARFSWSEVAEFTAKLIDSDEYITQAEVDDRLRRAAADKISTEIEEKIAEIIEKYGDSDKFFVNLESESVTGVYYNPDSTEGGQLVYSRFGFDDIDKALLSDKPADHIYTVADVSLVDITDPEFVWYADAFLDDRECENGSYVFVSDRSSRIEELKKFIESACEFDGALRDQRIIHLEVPQDSNTKSDIPIANARQKAFANFRLEYGDDGIVITADSGDEKGLVLYSFGNGHAPAEIFGFLKKNGYIITGYDNAERVMETKTVSLMSDESEISDLTRQTAKVNFPVKMSITTKSEESINAIIDVALGTGATVEKNNRNLRYGDHEIDVDTWESRADEIKNFALEQGANVNEHGIFLMVVNLGINGGLDVVYDYRFLDKAVREAQERISNGAVGAAVYNLETKKIEFTDGEFDVEHSFTEDVLKANGYPIKEKQTDFERARELINDFCDREHGSAGDFSDLTRVPLAYTTDEETDLPINVYIGLFFMISCGITLLAGGLFGFVFLVLKTIYDGFGD